MTCIVGVTNGKNVWLGGDSAGTAGDMSRTIIKDPKVFVRDEIGFGVCGSPKVMDVLAHAIELPKQTDGTDRSFLVGQLVPAIRRGLKKFDAVFKHPQHGTLFEGALLIGYRGCLYQLESNFQLIQAANGFDATGSGGELARGSLQSTRGVGDPKKRILIALEASAAANAGVAPPFVVVKV
jgi:ATP-dependent protease HslVU (ClpYQ) peptidase subunit